ncbi:MAG: hypothetical protein AAFY35_09415 [Pseudomonadota bacterium]
MPILSFNPHIRTKVFASSTILLIGAPVLADGHFSPEAVLQGIQGQALVSIHDGDMVASAYVNGELGLPETPNALTVLLLKDMSVAQIEVSNSVAGAPTAVDVTPGGRFAVVSESFGPRAEGGTSFGDLTAGGSLTLVDISDLASPVIVDEVEVGSRPDGLSISPDGSLVAVALHQSDGRGIAFVPLLGGTLGEVSHASLPAMDPSHRVSHVEWHPTDDIVAIHMVDQAVIHFARVMREGDVVTLKQYGNSVLTSKYPFMGRFSPNGALYLTSNLYWGPDITGIWTEAPEGDMTTIRMGHTSGDDAPRHVIVDRAITARSPEGIAISPDGEWVVTTNLEVSYAPADDPRHTPYSSLTLIDLDPETGMMETVGTYAYDGILPEAAAFDASGSYVMVMNYDQLEGGPAGGSIDFWRLVEGDRPKLVQTRMSIPVPHGPHSTTLVN